MSAKDLSAPGAACALALLLLGACSRASDAPAQSEAAKDSARLARRIDPRCFALPLDRMAEPVLLEGEEPSYPLQALAAGAEGRVSAGCTITDEGRVVDCRILESDVPAIDASVLAALQRRIYCPATRDTWPVSVEKTFNFRFRLADDAPRRVSRAR
ncbi:MAG TPA: energy transducer TonB [Anaeromyxobacter sp.]